MLESEGKEREGITAYIHGKSYCDTYTLFTTYFPLLAEEKKELDYSKCWLLSMRIKWGWNHYHILENLGSSEGRTHDVEVKIVCSGEGRSVRIHSDVPIITQESMHHTLSETTPRWQ